MIGLGPIHTTKTDLSPQDFLLGFNLRPYPKQHNLRLPRKTSPGVVDKVSLNNIQKRLETEEMKSLLRKLRQIDQEVKAHEMAHLIAAGRYARGGPHYQYIRGPDGCFYAIGGDIKIDTSPVPGDPEATLEKARIIKRAALAPAHPSAQDRMVAALADRLAAKALMEIQNKKLEAQRQRALMSAYQVQGDKKVPNKDRGLDAPILDLWI